MKEQLITFDTAKLAKEKGFDIAVNNVYQDGNTRSPYFRELHNFNGDDEMDYYSAPTQSLLQRWLWEKHKCWISIEIAYRQGSYEYRNIEPYIQFTGIVKFWVENPPKEKEKGWYGRLIIDGSNPDPYKLLEHMLKDVLERIPFKITDEN